MILHSYDIVETEGPQIIKGIQLLKEIVAEGLSPNLYTSLETF